MIKFEPGCKRLCYVIIDEMKKLIWLFLLSLSSFSQTAESIVQTAESAFRGLETFQADFEQLYYSAASSIPLKETGKFYFAQPDRMKWIYENPEKKTFLSRDGAYSYYIPEDNQLYKGTIDQDRPESEVLFILSGQRSLLESYAVDVSPFPADSENTEQLKLTPKVEDGFTHLLLELDGKTHLIRRLILFDWAGNKTEYIFKRTRMNVRFGDKLFELNVPQDVEIIEY
jgi:outer membrane lipoprotein carrier protein